MYSKEQMAGGGVSKIYTRSYMFTACPVCVPGGEERVRSHLLAPAPIVLFSIDIVDRLYEHILRIALMGEEWQNPRTCTHVNSAQLIPMQILFIRSTE